MRRTLTFVFAAVLLAACAPRQEPQVALEEPQVASLPQPELALRGFHTDRGQESSVLRVLLSVRNYGEYPGSIFTAAPGLPPCEETGEATRTWMQFYAQDGAYLDRACTLVSPEQLRHTSFAIPHFGPVPSAAYAEIWDRETNARSRSAAIPLLPEENAGPRLADLASPRSYYPFIGGAPMKLDDRFGPPTARYRGTWEYLIENRDGIALVACFSLDSGNVAAAYLREAPTEKLMRCLGEPI
jgi:hypothetical protein